MRKKELANREEYRGILMRAACIPPFLANESPAHVSQQDDAYNMYRDDEKSMRPPPRRWTWQSDRCKMVAIVIATLGVLLFVSFGFSATIPALTRQATWPALKFTAQGTFQISVFEDLHFGENAWDQWGPQQDVNSVKVINEVLDVEQPQLVVLNGDLITGDNAYKENATVYVDQIVGPLVQRGLPWASTYGNHDSHYNLSREGILAEEKKYPNALTEQMVFGREAAVSNYYLPVYPSTGGNIPCLILWFFDSRGGFYYQETNATGSLVGQPDWVDQSVVDWFIATNANLTRVYNTDIPSLAFVHIPTNVSQALQTEARVDANRQPGINDDYILAQQAQGWCPDGTNDGSCSYGGQDIPFVRALASTPGLRAVFSGHDHGDTWCYRWASPLPGVPVSPPATGLDICFGQHSGYGGYGTWTRGSRQIRLTESRLAGAAGGGGIDTWIRLEDRGVVGAVTLNATYGEDVYPATPNTHTSCPTCDYSDDTPRPGT